MTAAVSGPAQTPADDTTFDVVVVGSASPAAGTRPAALEAAPFHAVKIVPGDLGTKGGLRTDARARVLRTDGTAIPGLYAAGNASAAVMGHTYAGAGATIGPAMTFGYLAVLGIAEAAAKAGEATSHRGRP